MSYAREVLNAIFYVFRTGCQWRARPERHLPVDTLGLLLRIVVHLANVQDRDGAFKLLRRARRLFPFIEHVGKKFSKGRPMVADTASRVRAAAVRTDVLSSAKITWFGFGSKEYLAGG